MVSERAGDRGVRLKTTRLRVKIAQLRQLTHRLDQIKEELKTLPSGQVSMTDPDARSMATRRKRPSQ